MDLEHPGTAGPDALPDAGTGQGAEPEVGATAPQPEEIDWTNPADILSKAPPELHPLVKKFQSSFGKATGKLAREREALERDADRQLAQRYKSDPEFRRQFILEQAQQLGLLPAGAQPGAAPTQADPRLVAAIEAQLAPELKWIAPSIAAAQTVGYQAFVQPLHQQREAERRSQFDQEWSTETQAMATKYPGWDAHEDDIAELAEFLVKSDRFTHPKFGSKLELLYRMVTNNAAAVAEANRRAGDAVRARVTTGQSGRTAVPNIDERVRAAKTRREAMEIAAADAIAEAKRNGLMVE